MRVMALVPCIPDTSPGQRYRIEQWEPELRKRGVEIEFEAFESPELNKLLYVRGRTYAKGRCLAEAFRRRVRTLRRLSAYDAVYVFREAALLGPALLERWIWRAGVPIIFDFDDAIFVPYISPSNGWLSLLKFAGKTRSLCRLASHVIAGNKYLAEYALRYNKNVTVIPTTVDTEKYSIQLKEAAPVPPTIGWTGSYSTVQHLYGLRRTLAKLAESEDFRLRVIGPTVVHFEGLTVDYVPWRSDSEVEDLRPVDIGIMPLPDSRWNRGKCGCKALQYMALGIPVVCSPTGVNSEIIQDGKNGFIANTEDEWIEKLTRLLQSPELRARLGAAGRATVEQGYSAASQLQRIFEVFKSVAGHDGDGK